MKLSTKQKKLAIIGTVSAVVLLSGGVGYSVVKSNEYKADLDAFKSGVSKENTEVSNLQAKIESAYLKTNKQYLSPTFTKDDFTALEKSVNSLLNDNKKLDNLLSKLKDTDKKAFNSTLSRSTKLKELSDNFSALKSKFRKQTDLNKLFSKGVLVGDKLSEQPIADSITKSDFDKVKSSLYVKDTKDAFNKSINDGLTFAEKQLKQVSDAKAKESELYKGNKVTDKANKDSLSQFKALVEGIKNPNIKKSFDKSLKAISDKVTADEKAKEAKAKEDAEAKAKEVGGNVEKQADGSYIIKANDGKVYQAKGDGKVEIYKPKPTSNSGSSSNSSGSTGSSSNQGGTSTNTGSTSSGNTSNSSTGGTQGSTSTQPKPSQPSTPQPSQPSQPTPQPSQPTPQPTPQPVVPTQPLGNSGMLFDTLGQADDWAYAQWSNSGSQWYAYYFDVHGDNPDGKTYAYAVNPVKMSDGSFKYTVKFYIKYS